MSEIRRILQFAAILSAFAGCINSDCVNEVRQELRSPDGKMKAVLFTRNCGATTALSTQVSILTAGERISNQPGNAFVIDKGNAQIAWDQHGALVITFDRGARIFRQEAKAHGVALKYQEIAKTD